VVSYALAQMLPIEDVELRRRSVNDELDGPQKPLDLFHRNVSKRVGAVGIY